MCGCRQGYTPLSRLWTGRAIIRSIVVCAIFTLVTITIQFAVVGRNLPCVSGRRAFCRSGWGAECCIFA